MTQLPKPTLPYRTPPRRDTSALLNSASSLLLTNGALLAVFSFIIVGILFAALIARFAPHDILFLFLLAFLPLVLAIALIVCSLEVPGRSRRAAITAFILTLLQLLLLVLVIFLCRTSHPGWEAFLNPPSIAAAHGIAYQTVQLLFLARILFQSPH